MQTLFYYKSYVNIAYFISRANDGETKTNFWLRFTRMGDGGTHSIFSVFKITIFSNIFSNI